MRHRTLLPLLVLAALPAACRRVPGSVGVPTQLWAVTEAAPDERGVIPEHLVQLFSRVADEWILLDSASFRPFVQIPRHAQAPAASQVGGLRTQRCRMSVVSNRHGSYQRETVRGLGTDSNATKSVADSVTRILLRSGACAILLDFQGLAGDDVPALMALSSVLSESFRSEIRGGQVAILVPPGDTAGYPTGLLARAADHIVVRLFDEHGPGTAPGPTATPQWAGRRLGERSAAIGASRIVAGLPLHGWVWNRDGSTRRVTLEEARRLAAAAGVPVSRDEASRALHAASDREGWVLWVGDHETLGAIVGEARQVGITRFALLGITRSDTLLIRRLGEVTAASP